MAEAMLKLRAAYLSDNADAYWDWHVQQDQQRLYDERSWKVARK